MDEFAFGVTGDNMHYESPVNPEMPSLAPGGSSSGSAVAVAAELVDFALGIDTVGGVRIPASFCGIFGFRPSHGVVSTVGTLGNAQSLDTIALLFKLANSKQVEEVMGRKENGIDLASSRVAMLRSWLPLLCRACNGIDTSILSSNDKAETVRALEEMIEKLNLSKRRYCRSGFTTSLILLSPTGLIRNRATCVGTRSLERTF